MPEICCLECFLVCQTIVEDGRAIVRRPDDLHLSTASFSLIPPLVPRLQEEERSPASVHKRPKECMKRINSLLDYDPAQILLCQLYLSLRPPMIVLFVMGPFDRWRPLIHHHICCLQQAHSTLLRISLNNQTATLWTRPTVNQTTCSVRFWLLKMAAFVLLRLPCFSKFPSSFCSGNVGRTFAAIRPSLWRLQMSLGILESKRPPCICILIATVIADSPYEAAQKPAKTVHAAVDMFEDLGACKLLFSGRASAFVERFILIGECCI